MDTLTQSGCFYVMFLDDSTANMPKKALCMHTYRYTHIYTLNHIFFTITHTHTHIKTHTIPHIIYQIRVPPPARHTTFLIQQLMVIRYVLVLNKARLCSGSGRSLGWCCYLFLCLMLFVHAAAELNSFPYCWLGVSVPA